MWTLGGGALLAAAGVTAYAVRARSATLFGPSVWRGDRSRRAVALTFDDGPSEATPRVLEILSRYGVRATFFQCGANARRLPRIAREVAAEGHEVGNHSYSHAPFYFRGAGFIAGEIGRAQSAIADAAGCIPEYFRAPYGARWFGLRQAQERFGLLGVMWTTLGLDWKLPAARVAARLARGASNGAIFCLHDGRELRPDPDLSGTLGALRRVIPQLLGQGYRFEPVGRILRPPPLAESAPQTR
jgi:peptidoglycan/xylan/chitin deacetylase (PgdA/CDA1 family)